MFKKIKETKLERLFKPGNGVTPPYLAGREREKKYFQDCAESLIEKATVPRDVIVYGPRGNGKTVLLDNLETEILKQYGKQLDILWLTPDDMSTLTELITRIVGDDNKLKSRLTNIIVGTSLPGFHGSAEFDLSSLTATLTKVLQAKCQNKPFILIIDEAHTLHSDIARYLLNASQNVRGEDCPFLLVLAGTPNLKTTLQQAGASFWSRCQQFPIGRLSTAETKDALTLPLSQKPYGVTFEDGVTEYIAQVSHGYPYFIQIWGERLTINLAKTGARKITMETVKQVESGVSEQISLMYEDRYNEISTAKLIPAAEILAAAFLKQEQIRQKQTESIVAAYLAENPLPGNINDPVGYAMQVFNDTGFIWQVLGGDRKNIHLYEAGIPSLMPHILENK